MARRPYRCLALMNCFQLSTQQPGLTFARHWHHVSARSETLGPLAVKIATLLMGKHKPRGIFSQANDQAGDYVVVTEAERVLVTGKKAEQKKYYRHSMYPGGLKTETFQERIAKRPEAVSRYELRKSLRTKDSF